jgi:hypothetical protein
MVGQIGLVVIVGIVRQVDEGRVVMEDRRKEVSLAAQASVESFKPGTRGPLIERTGEAGFSGREFVALAEHRGAIAIQLHHLGQRRFAIGTLGGLTRKRGGELGNGPHVDAHIPLLLFDRVGIEHGCSARRPGPSVG